MSETARFVIVGGIALSLTAVIGAAMTSFTGPEQPSSQVLAEDGDFFGQTEPTAMASAVVVASDRVDQAGQTSDHATGLNAEVPARDAPVVVSPMVLAMNFAQSGESVQEHYDTHCGGGAAERASATECAALLQAISISAKLEELAAVWEPASDDHPIAADPIAGDEFQTRGLTLSIDETVTGAEADGLAAPEAASANRSLIAFSPEADTLKTDMVPVSSNAPAKGAVSEDYGPSTGAVPLPPVKLTQPEPVTHER